MGRVNGFSWEHKRGCKEPLTWKSHAEQDHQEQRRAFPCSLQALTVIPRRKLYYCAWKKCTLIHSHHSSGTEIPQLVPWRVQLIQRHFSFTASQVHLLFSSLTAPALLSVWQGWAHLTFSPCSMGSDLLLPPVWLGGRALPRQKWRALCSSCIQRRSVKGTHDTPCFNPCPIHISAYPLSLPLQGMLHNHLLASQTHDHASFHCGFWILYQLSNIAQGCAVFELPILKLLCHGPREGRQRLPVVKQHLGKCGTVQVSAGFQVAHLDRGGLVFP